jgi:hypothetical protein
MSPRNRTLIAMVVVICACSVLGRAQAPAPQEQIAALKQSLAANQAALRQYTWIETTTTSLKGEVKKQEQKRCYYGADGKVQKEPVPGAAPASQPPSGGGGGRDGRLKKRIVENKVDDLKDYMGRTVALIQSYVPPDSAKIQAAQSAGHVSAQKVSDGNVKVTIADYLKAGDALAIGLDTAAKQLTSLDVQSYVDKPKDDDVTMNVTFGRLEDGTSYPQQVMLDVKAKKIQVKVVNSGYKKQAS